MSKKFLFLTSFVLVLSLAYTSYGDTTPPQEDPMKWQFFPAAWDEGSIVMTAVDANDVNDPPEEYYFEEVNNPGTINSGWINVGNPVDVNLLTYTFSGLAPDTKYYFRVKARDSATIPNETAWSSVKSAKTYPASDPNALKLDFNNNTAADNDAQSTEEAFLAYTLDENGREVNGVVIDVTGNVMSRERTAPYYVPVDSNHEQLYKSLFTGFDHTADMNITLWGLGIDRDCNIVLYGFDHSSTPNRVADWYCNGTYLLTIDCNGGIGNWPRCFDCYPPTVYKGEYDFNAVGHTDYLGRLHLESVRDPCSRANDIYVIVNGIEIIPKGAFVPTGYAHRPVPFDGTPYPRSGEMEIDAPVSWLPGTPVDQHNLYFDTNESDVASATKGGSHPNLMYYRDLSGTTVTQDPCGPRGFLTLDQTYYWRVDTNNPVDPCEGDVWKFTTKQSYMMENFNDYTGQSIGSYPLRPNNWLDYHELGGQGEVHLHDGATAPSWATIDGNSLQFIAYNSYAPPWSEVGTDMATIVVDSNWIDMGVKSISLFFGGLTTNPISNQPYLKLVDCDGNSAIVPYVGDANDVREPYWHEWIVGLNEFTAVNPGLNLNCISKFIIGMVGGTVDSEIYIEDIELWARRCALSKRSNAFAQVDYSPGGLTSGDCIVDELEVRIMGSQWLLEDAIIPTLNPGEANLVVYYPLDQANEPNMVYCAYPYPNDPCWTGTTWNRTMGSHRNTTFAAPGAMGEKCMYFDGSDGARIQCPNTGFEFVKDYNQITLSCWINWRGPHVPDKGKCQDMISKRTGWDDDHVIFMLECDTQPNNDGALAFRHYAGTPNPWPDLYTANNVLDPFIGQWAHVAATFDGTTARIYLNGQDRSSGNWGFSGWAVEPNMCRLCIGNSTDEGLGMAEGGWNDCPEAFNGYIDEVRIYNRGLTPAEIGYLSDLTPDDGYKVVPIASSAELYAEASNIGTADFTANIDSAGTVTGTTTGWTDSNGPWYEYTSGWWNIWFDNLPHNKNRMKIVVMDITVQRTAPDANVQILVGGSTNEWADTAIDDPPLPEYMLLPGDEDLYIDRTIDGGMIFDTINDANDKAALDTGNPVPILTPVFIWDYNPGWVFVDIQGKNVEISQGTASPMIRHECRATGIINFLDYAVVANEWLKQELFP